MQTLFASKIVVFDINKTLVHLSRFKIPGYHPHFHANAYFGYIRPHFHYLAYHQQQLAQKITFLLWTSMQKHNAEKIAKILQNQGFKFHKLYCQDHCKEDLSKDLNIIAKELKVSINNIYLVDDTIEKRIEEQNFIHIQQFNGIDSEDKELLRIVKQLYTITQTTIDNQIENQAVSKEVQCRLKLLTISQSKNGNNENKKYVEKPQQKKWKQKQEMQFKMAKNQKIRSQVKQESKIKCIVFDINETLLLRSQHKIEGSDPVSKNKHYYYYVRPYIAKLKQFIETHNVKMCLWSSIKSYNCTQFVKLLASQGLKIDRLFSGEQLIEGKKDLSYVSSCLQISIENIVLVDDSLNKRVKGQNFIHISIFNAANRQDDALLHLISQLGTMCQQKEQK